MFQVSVGHSITTSPLMASMIRTAGVDATSLPNAARSCVTPVDVSLNVENTAFASGFSDNALDNWAGWTDSPGGTLTLTASTANALQMLRNRSPNRPLMRQIALLPA